MRLRRARATPSVSAQPVTENARRAWLAALFALISAYLFLVVVVQRIAASSNWITGDWLINYSDGFVRRGLMGEIGRQLHYSRRDRSGVGRRRVQGILLRDDVRVATAACGEARRSA
jgi:hypothetical protein